VRLLLIEDDAELTNYLRADLVKAGFAVDVADNGIDGEFLGGSEPYDAIVLDLGLPQKSGLEILASWRKQKNRVPVIVLTARDAWYERVDGLHGKMSHSIETGTLRLDEDTQQVKVADDESQQLTGTEFRLLRYMMLNTGKILSKTNLSDHVYDQDSERDSNLIEVYVRRLREKIGHHMILTKRGQGYVFNDPTTWTHLNAACNLGWLLA